MAGMVTTERDLPGVDLSGRIRNRYGVEESLSDVYSFQGHQKTTSFRTGGSQDIDQMARMQLRDFRQSGVSNNGAYGSTITDRGHPFDTIKKTVTCSHPRVEWYEPDSEGSQYYVGPLVPSIGLPVSQLFPTVPGWDSTKSGTTAINDTVPVHPAASVANLVGELARDGLPTIPGDQLRQSKGYRRSLNGKINQLRGIGSEGLNVVFAWAPLIADVDKILHAVIKGPEILDQYERDSGRNIRRKRSYPPEVGLIEDPRQEYVPRLAGLLQSSDYNGLLKRNDAYWEVSTYKSRQISFSGSYTYALENGSDLMSRLRGYAQKAEHLLGLGLTPDVLYNLAPWTWLADWFTDFGDAVSAASAFQRDGLILRYGYIMCHDVLVRQYSLDSTKILRRDFGTLTMTFRTERKQRVRANPFGFGLEFSDLDERQLGILALLGISNAPRIGF